jgi:hypothetical protein
MPFRTGLFRRRPVGPSPLLLFVCPLGGLQWIDFLRHFFDLNLNIGGSRAFSRSPFCSRIRINPAVLTRCTRDDLGASFALIDDRHAAAPVESTALLSHEAALDAAFGGLTIHFFSSFLIRYSKSEKNRPASKPRSWPSGSVIPFLQGVLWYQNSNPMSRKKFALHKSYKVL